MSDATKSQAAPYHFVPVVPQLAPTGKPMFHDQLGTEGSLTGEICCTLEALTPLLAANDQYDFENATEGLQKVISKLVVERLTNADPEASRTVDPTKKILEPLTLGRVSEDVPGRVLIAGAALKGMIRSSLAALFSAPMERVVERTYSYRPNGVGRFPGKDDSVAVTTHAGVVAQVEKDGSLRVLAMKLTDLEYVRPEYQDCCLTNLGGKSKVDDLVAKVRQATSEQEMKTCLEPLKTTLITPKKPTTGYLLPCRTGLDGKGILQRAFNEVHPDESTRCYKWILAPGNLPSHSSDLIPAPIVEGWRQTLKHLADKDGGHLRMPPTAKREDKEKVCDAASKSINQMLAEGFRPGDVVFFEKAGNRVVTLGHHFRYRWRYRDSIRFHEPSPNKDTVVGQSLRDVLCPHQLPGTSGPPERLAMAQLFFGFSATEIADNTVAPTSNDPQTGSRPKASDFDQLAGRVAINMAVEQFKDEELLKDENQIQEALRNLGARFVNGDNDGCVVLLRPLSSPKPSAVEHYLEQDTDILKRRHTEGHTDEGLLCTYGDDASDPSAGRLRGRKCYLHSPKAATDFSLFELGLPDGQHHAEDVEMLTSDQAGIGRFLSRPGTKFRFTIRFLNIRPWELGALLFVLSADLKDLQTLLEWFGLTDDQGRPLKRWLEQAKRRLTKNPKQLVLAHKLGHGRPLGLGSVRLTVDMIKTVQPSKDGSTCELQPLDKCEELLAEFAFWLACRLDQEQCGEWMKCVLLPWLEIHRFVGRRHHPYPRHPEERTIFDYHSNLRREHAEGRKNKHQASGSGPSQSRGLLSLEELSGQEG